MKGLTLLAFVLVGCGSYREDLEMICNAQELSGAKNPDGGLAEVGPWLDENLRTKKARDLLRGVAQYGTVDVLKEELAANGIAKCPLIDPRP